LLIGCIFLTSINFWTLNISLVDALFSGLYIFGIVLLGCSTVVQQKYFRLRRFFIYDKTNFMFWYTLSQFILTISMVWMEFVFGYYTKIKFINNGTSDDPGDRDDPTVYNLFIGDFFASDGYTRCLTSLLVVATMFFNVCCALSICIFSINYSFSFLTSFQYTLLWDTYHAWIHCVFESL
jgi:hypothetical protein